MPDDHTTVVEVGATTATDAIDSADGRSPRIRDDAGGEVDVESEAGVVTMRVHRNKKNRGMYKGKVGT